MILKNIIQVLLAHQSAQYERLMFLDTSNTSSAH
jgi:hypothetical protein